MMNNNRVQQNRKFSEFKRYEHEIYLDINDVILKSDRTIVKSVIEEIGINEIHHIIKYYQKITLNALFFNDRRIFLEYHKWLYRVYYYRGLDLDFFSFLNHCFQNICLKYMNSTVCMNINELFNYILEQHELLKTQASKKRYILDEEEKAKTFAQALISGDSKKALQLCKEESATLDNFLSFYNHIISNAMKYIGFLWESSELSISKEHIATNTLEEVIMEVLNSFENESKKEKHVFLSCAPSELHGLGVKVASKVFQIQGYKVSNLGSNIPFEEVKKAIIEFKPDFIILTATLQTSLIEVAFLIDEINKDKMIFTKDFKVAIAGGAFESLTSPSKLLQADFYLDELKDLNTYS